jgi:cystathionine beta-lyase/cystathionine gamma-synthase
MTIFGALGVETTFADASDLPAFEAAISEVKPGAVVVESITNPLLRVCALDQIAAIARRAGAPLIVDNTFATPMLMRPLELGASIVIHSATKYLAGHGDVLGGVIVSDAENFEVLNTAHHRSQPGSV